MAALRMMLTMETDGLHILSFCGRGTDGRLAGALAGAPKKFAAISVPVQ